MNDAPPRSSWFVEWIKSALLEVQEYFRLCAAAIRGAFSRPFYAHDLMAVSYTHLRAPRD